jgi:Nuclease-related domain
MYSYHLNVFCIFLSVRKKRCIQLKKGGLNMARVIEKNTNLEQEYKHYHGVAIFWFIITIISFLLFIPTQGISGIPFLISGIIGGYYSQKASSLKSGVTGEKRFLKLISNLPDTYTIFNDINFINENRKTHIDYVIVGPTGVFVVEVKNHNGEIVANDTDRTWLQEKVGRQGTPYTSSLSNPIKQVNGQVYGLSNYFKLHQINEWIEGIVFFSNPGTIVNVRRSNMKVPIFAMGMNGEDELFDYIINRKNKSIPKARQEQIIRLLKQ